MKMNMIAAAAVSLCAAVCGQAAEISPRLLIDTHSFKVDGRFAKWQQVYSGWEKTEGGVIHELKRPHSGYMRYQTQLRLVPGDEVWIEFLDEKRNTVYAETSGLDSNFMRPGSERIRQGLICTYFQPSAPVKYVRLRGTASVDFDRLLKQPFKLTVDFAVDEDFETIWTGTLPWKWEGRNAAVTNLPYRVQWHWGGDKPKEKKGHDRFVQDHVVAVAADGFVKPFVEERFIPGDFAYEFSAFVDGKTDFEVGGVKVRELYDFTPGIWYDFRVESTGGNGKRTTTRLKLNGREIAKDVKLDGFTLRNLAKDASLLVDDVRVFALENPADYPVRPVKPEGEEKWDVGINVCNLWHNGYHAGWRCIDDCGLKPVLGYYDGGLPEVADWEIKYMVEHGVDFQSICWYSDVNEGPIRHPRNDYHLTHGFKNARYSDMMEYCIIFEMGSGGMAYTLDAWKNHFVPYFIEHHFKDPRYKKLDGKVAFPIFGAWLLPEKCCLGSKANVKAAFDYMDAEVKKIPGLKGVEYILCHWNSEDAKPDWQEMGFTSYVAYGIGDDLDFEKVKAITKKRTEFPGLYAIPLVGVGFDAVPWNARHRPMIEVGEFAKSLAWCRDEFIPGYAKKGTWQARTMWLSNWNEYGEGTYIMPVEGEKGFGYLDAIRTAFTDEKADAKINVKPTAAQQERLQNLYTEKQRIEPTEWTRVICQEKGRQIGWPTIIRRRTGELYCVFSGDRDSHIDPYGKVQCVRSIDGGETWGRVETIYSSALDDRDAGVLELPDGELLVFSFTSIHFALSAMEGGIPTELYEKYRAEFEKVSEKDMKKLSGPIVLRSGYASSEWEKPVKMHGIAPHGGILLKDGRVLFVGRSPAKGQSFERNIDICENPPELICEESRDNGKTWQVLSKLVPPAPWHIEKFHEPHLVEAADGTIVVQFRKQEGDWHTMQAESADGGKTWTRIHDSGIYGHPSHLLRLKDGRILSTFSRRDQNPTGFGQYAVISRDNGRTWDLGHEIKISGCPAVDMGYPSTAELDDGWMITVWYQRPAPSEKPALMGTKWRLSGTVDRKL